MWYSVVYARKKWYGKCHTSHTTSAALVYTDISVIMSHPESIHVTTNSEMEFSCVAIATEIIFFVNETSSS